MLIQPIKLNNSKFNFSHRSLLSSIIVNFVFGLLIFFNLWFVGGFELKHSLGISGVLALFYRILMVIYLELKMLNDYNNRDIKYNLNNTIIQKDNKI